MIVAHVSAIPTSYRVSTENGWKSVLLRNANRIKPNWLRLKRLIPIEHDLNVANVLKDNSAVECEGINIEWTNKLKSTEW